MAAPQMKNRMRWGAVALLGLLVLAPGRAARAQASADEQLAAASALFDAKKYTEAAVRLEAFLTANPTHPKAGPAALALARSYAELRQYAKAVPAYEKAIATRDAAVLQIAQLGLGEAGIYAAQYAKAAAALEAAVKSPLKPGQGALAWYWLGQANFHLEKYQPSEEAYLRVTRDFPTSDLLDGAWYGAGLAALRLNKTDLARQRMKTVIDKYPESVDRPGALVVLAQLDLADKKYREARAGFEAALAAKPGDDLKDDAEEGLAVALLELQDYAAAAPRLEAVIARRKEGDQQRYRAQLSLGHCRYRQKLFEPAYLIYVEAAKSTEGAVAGEGHYWAANAALQCKRPNDAVFQFTRVFTRFPRHDLAARAQLRLAEVLMEQKQSDAATAAYRAVIEKFPTSEEADEARKALGDLAAAETDPVKLAAALKTVPPAQRGPGTLRLARLLLNAKRFPEAERALVDLAALKPPAEVAAEGQYLLGAVREAQGAGQAAGAVAAFTEALRLLPGAPWAADAHMRLAWLYLDLGKPADSEKAALAALALKPAPELDRQIRLAQVQALLDQERWDPALEACRQLLAMNPPPETVATVVYTQAWVGEKRGKPEESLPLWERILAEFPKSPYCAEAHLRAGDARFRAQEYAEARDKYAASLMADPKSPVAAEARFKLGSALYNLDRFAEAGAEFDAVVANKDAGDYVPEALYWAGRALEKAKKNEEAIQRLTRLTTQFPRHDRVADAKIRLAALKALAGM
jgi:TolA-binding protein